MLRAAALLLAAAGPALAQPAAPAGKAPGAAATKEQAREILMRMAGVLGGAQRFSVSVRAGYDAVQKSGEKIEFGETRKVALSRPDRLRVESERSDGARSLVVFDGKAITLVDLAHNAYATAPQPGGIDQSLDHFIRDLGMRLPLALLLRARLPAELDAQVRSVAYVEKTTMHGVASHHLAARTDAVDFQVWIADGEQALPQRVVITYRKSPGQPQFRAQFSDWNLAPALGDATFAAALPAGAQKVAFAAQLARGAKAARPASAGAKAAKP
jgi:hypothetical protein